jgi:hypothetical protein
MGAITMPDKKDQNIEAMAKLLFLTQQGTIAWNSEDPSVIEKKTTDETISSVFLSQYKDKLIRIYLRKYKALGLQGLGLKGLGLAGLGLPSVNYDWKEEVILELTDDKGNSIWQFPKETILNDLLQAVKYKASGAYDLIQSLLSDNSD